MQSRIKTSEALQIRLFGRVTYEYCPKPPKSRSKKIIKASGPYTKVSYITCPACGISLWVTNDRRTCSIECACSITIKNGIRSKQVIYKDIALDSSWELELAKSLDENNIKWVRPEPLKWLDENNLEHNYFPDFYLPEYDIFVDPKNKHAFNVQKHKIEQLKKQFTNIVFLVNIEEVRQFALMVKQDITRVF